MEVRVLGPVELVVEDAPRTLQGGERELLAVLALSAGAGGVRHRAARGPVG